MRCCENISDKMNSDLQGGDKSTDSNFTREQKDTFM